MKKLLFCLTVLCISLSAKAQDVLVTKEGDALKVYGLEVSASAVFYHETENANSPIIRKDKADLLMIKFQDGRIEIIGKETENPQPQAQPQAPESEAAAEKKLTAEDIAANAAAMERWKEPIPGYIGKAKKKKATLLYCVFRPTEESVLADANVEMAAKCVYEENYIAEAKYVVSIKNKTSKTIYLDLANSFFVRGEMAEPYYVPTATSTTSGVTMGVGVNMGAVAGAMGVGGSVGKLASGINVGSSNSEYNTTVTYTQRVISVPPMSSKILDSKIIIPISRESFDVSPFFGNDITMKKRTRYANGYFYPHLQNSGAPIKIGEVRDYIEGDLPLKIGTFVTYSFTEDIEAPRKLQSFFNIKRIIGVPEYSSAATFGIPLPMVSPKALSPEQLKDVTVILWQIDD